MKTMWVIMALVLAFFVGVNAQTTYINGSTANITFSQAVTPVSCAWPSGVTTGASLCMTPSGLYYAVNGGAFSAVQTGVASVSFSQVAGTLAATQLPATFTCNATATVASNGATTSLSGCH
jgi:hypothetical protein